MLAGIHNFTIDQGAYWRRSLKLFNPDESIYDLSGYTARMQLRRDLKASAAIISLTTENGRISIEGATGTITLILQAADTATILHDCVYDLEIVTPDSKPYRVIQGNIRLNPEVTR
jgi:hypothetical protein